MPGSVNNNQPQNSDLEQENQRLRQQVQALQQRNEALTAQFAKRTRKLQATESRLQRLATNLPGVIFQYCLAPDGTQSFPYVSEKSREIYGIEPEHFAQVFELVHPEDSDRLQATIQQSALTLNRFDCQYRVITPSGTLKWLQALSQPVQQDNGDIIWDGIVIDISDRKTAEARLRQQEAQYRQVFETISDGLGIVDLEQGELVEVNPAYHQMHGYAYAEFLALPYIDIVHPNSHELLAQFIADVKEGRVFTGQAQNLHRNGEIIDIEVKGIPFLYQGKLHALVLVRDISEKVRWERERDRQEQALRSIVEGTAAHTGAEFFRACAKSLAMALEVAYVLIAEIDHSQPDQTLANVIAAWMQTDFGDNFQYDLSGTPCRNVFEQGAVCRYGDSVQTLFPDDAYLAPMGAESYVGIPLVDSQGSVVGLIAVLHTEAMADNLEMQASILEIFAARVGAEIERMRAEIALVESTAQIQQQAKQEQLLNQIANQIRTSLDLNRILETTVREIKQFLGRDRAHAS